MIFADLHRHILPGLDDGVSSEEEMRQMLDEAYQEGVRLLCATPHYHPGFFRYSEEALLEAFGRLKAYAAGAYPELKLMLGAELRYAAFCADWLESGACRRLGDSDFVLVDFLPDVRAEDVMTALRALRNTGYCLVLAHPERYASLGLAQLEELRSMGVRLQLDAGSLFGEWGFGARRRARQLVRHYRADVIASDAHHPGSGCCRLDRAFRLVSRIAGPVYAEELFWRNPHEILTGSPI